MTGRGRGEASPARPTTPPDPTLASRPVPQKRAFPIRSFGPGAAIDTTAASTLQERSALWEGLNRTASASASTHREEDALGNGSLLETINDWEAVSWRDDQAVTWQPTWGYYIFLTGYGQTTQDSLPRAMEYWVKAIERQQGANTAQSDVYADEVFRRLRLDVVDDRDALEHASTDRVRDCFRALVHSFEIADDENRWVPPTRNKVCLVLDADKVQMLANLTFHDDRKEEFRALDQRRVQAVDIKWSRPETTRSSHRGARDVSVVALARMYSLLADGAMTLDEFIE